VLLRLLCPQFTLRYKCVQGADHRPHRCQVVPAMPCNWGRKLSGCAPAEKHLRGHRLSGPAPVSAGQRRTSRTMITMTAMRTIVPMPIYTTGSPSFESPGILAFPRRKLAGPGNGTVAWDHLDPMPFSVRRWRSAKRGRLIPGDYFLKASLTFSPACFRSPFDSSARPSASRPSSLVT
jgi:hypothetical protein